MSQIEYIKTRCSNPTCRAWTMRPGEIPLEIHLEGVGWTLETWAGEPVPLCERCSA